MAKENLKGFLSCTVCNQIKEVRQRSNSTLLYAVGCECGSDQRTGAKAQESMRNHYATEAEAKQAADKSKQVADKQNQNDDDTGAGSGAGGLVTALTVIGGLLGFCMLRRA